MNQTTRTLAATAFACLITSAAHAASIQSMTIEEIGAASGGIGISDALSGGGFGDWIPPVPPNSYSLSPAFFVSAGSSDGAIVMGKLQGNGQFTLGTMWGGSSVFLNSLHGAPNGTIENGLMSLDLSGFYADLPSMDLAFSLAPTAGPVAAVSAIDATHYYYSLDWVHLVNNDVYHITDGIQALGWNGSQIILHLEGVATLAPVPEAETYAMMLIGLGLVGLVGQRRRKQLS